MSKRAVGFALASLLALSLYGCGGEPEPVDNIIYVGGGTVLSEFRQINDVWTSDEYTASVVMVAASNSNQALIASDGSVFSRSVAGQKQWCSEGSQAIDIDIVDKLIIVAQSDGQVWSKQSCSDDDWQLLGGLSGVTAISASGDKIAALTSDGSFYTRTSEHGWEQESPAGSTSMVDVGNGGNTEVFVDTDGGIHIRNVDVSQEWLLIAEDDATDIVVGGGLVAFLRPDGDLFVRSSDISAANMTGSWMLVADINYVPVLTNSIAIGENGSMLIRREDGTIWSLNIDLGAVDIASTFGWQQHASSNDSPQLVGHKTLAVG